MNVLPMILPDWFYAGVIDDALVLTIAPLFRSDGRARALALPARAQARLPPGRWLEL